MADDFQPDPDPERMPWTSTDPAETVRLAIGVVAKALGEYGLGMPGQLSAGQAGEALEAASALLGSIAAGLRERAAEDEAEAEADADVHELLSPAIRQAFAKGCAPCSPDGLERAICEYRLAHVVLPGLDSPLLIWNDAEAGVPPSRAKVRDDISQIIKDTRSFRDSLARVSGEALGRVGLTPFYADGTTGFVESMFEQSGKMIGYAETALAELGGNLSPGRTLSPKTRLALWLGDFLASSGVPVVVGDKPSTEWALAYDLALEAAGDGPCPHARKTLQNAIALRWKERMSPAA